MKIINQLNLDTYVNANFNVLFSGSHGVGKTASILECFRRHNLKFAYLSCPTMDPYLDFVGVPRVVNRDGVDRLEIIQPERFANDDIEAIFLDELNRAPDKVLNAIMELIQFKSINGKRFNNLRFIWGAINPQGDEPVYKVNELDPAFLDRFHVMVRVPLGIDTDYFEQKFPVEAKYFIDWWTELPVEQRELVSPRRLEYAIMAYQAGVRLEDVLHGSTNVSKLRSALKSLQFIDQLAEIKTADAAKKFLKLNNATRLLDAVKNKNPDAISFYEQYGSLVPDELVSAYSSTDVGSMITLKSFFENIKITESDTVFKNSILKQDTQHCISSQAGLDNDVRVLNAQYPGLVSSVCNAMIDVLLRKIKDPTILLGDVAMSNVYQQLLNSFITNGLVKYSKINKINSGLKASSWTQRYQYFDQSTSQV